MRRICRRFTFPLFLLLISFVTAAQAPAQFNFQGIARHSNGKVIVAKPINLRFSVRMGSATGHTSYQERRATVTDSNGVFNAIIGSTGATNTIGYLDTVFWTAGPMFLQVELDTATGLNFINLGATQLLSVPYALFSNNSFNAGYAASAGYASSSGSADSSKHSTSSGSYFFEAFFTSAANSPFPGTIIFPTTAYNDLNRFTNTQVYDTTTGVFKAPEDGIYQFDVSLTSEQSTNVNNLDDVFLTKNGIKLRWVDVEFYDDIGYWHLCCILHLKANDTIRVEILEETYPPDPNGLIGAQSTFSGYKIR